MDWKCIQNIVIKYCPFENVWRWSIQISWEKGEGVVKSCFLLGFNITFKHLRSSRQCLLVALIFWPMCCHTGMSCCRHRTWHPTPPQSSSPHMVYISPKTLGSKDASQYTDTGPTYHVIHWCGTLHWNTQLPLLMSWVRPDWEILPQSSKHTSKRSTLWCSIWW